MVEIITGIDLSQEMFAIDMLRDLKSSSSQACSAILTTIWRPGLTVRSTCIATDGGGPGNLNDSHRTAVHRFTRSNFWSQLSLKFKEASDANQHFYELKQ